MSVDAVFDAWWDTKLAPHSFKDLARSAYEAGKEAGRAEMDVEWMKRMVDAYAKNGAPGDR
jgi:hypothetical protein